MKSWAIESRETDVIPKMMEVEKPQVAAGCVLVEVKGSSLNPADLKVISGKDGGGFLHAAKVPIRLGFDFAGVVVEIAPGVSGLTVGQEVYGFLPYSSSTRQGALSQYVAAPAAQVGPKPRSLSFEQTASLCTAATTALLGLRDKGKIKAGQKVLINGASGGVGSMAIQMAKHFGAEVWATSSAKNLEYVQQLGADHAVDYRSTSLESLSGPFDIVFDVASNAGYARGSKILAPGGTYITLLPTPALLLGWVSSLFSSKACRFVIAKSTREDLGLIAQWVEEGWLKPCVESVFSFNEVPEAIERLRKQSPRGKIALSFKF